ncbi:uncharacterized protein HD556DRAFT_1475272 [Suillus plorans]|uniref:DUF6532 domain-containing protein n=1 Tax=Suillus plorans TaxID=116603 RepID=A0A9P7AQQ4_9AGAM|nr:uncharacterized protein HD556DRAFT_1475272 [Suillus plorans]KAG1794382.1 hypothetical protein HD556DRAFT_1475272 [Suillus plorans]
MIEKSDDEEELVPPPPSQYVFNPPPRLSRRQPHHPKSGRKTSKLEDSDDGGDSDTGSYKHVPSDESEESDLEPVESIAQALLEETPAIASSDRHSKNKQAKMVRVSSARERKRAMETPKWNESVSTISEFDLSLVMTDDSIVPKEEEIDEDTQCSACDVAGARSKKASARDPMARLVYTRTGSVRLTDQNDDLHMVIQHGILELKAYIAFNHGYPEVIAKNTYGREILTNAVQYLKATPIEKRMRTDKGYLSALVGLIDTCASLFRRDIKDAACKNIVGYFQLGLNCSAILERLLPDHLYIFPQTFNAQGLPSPICKKPYQAEPIFTILFEIFFKNIKSIGSQVPQRFLDIAKNKAHRPEIPIPMLSIVCTAIYAALLGKKSKSNDDFKFTGNQFCDNYSYHVSVLEQIRATAPNKFHKMMSDIYEEVQCLRLDTSGTYSQDVSLTFLDIDGMDDE